MEMIDSNFVFLRIDAESPSLDVKRFAAVKLFQMPKNRRINGIDEVRDLILHAEHFLPTWLKQICEGLGPLQRLEIIQVRGLSEEEEDAVNASTLR